jgi:translocator protein
MKINYKILIICLAVVFLTAFIGSLFTSGNTDSSWYSENKPSITPPNYVFPIVWNILFFLIALSLYFVWIKAKTKIQKKKIAIVFGINFFLNAFWSFLFFELQKPAWAFAELIILWLSIISIIFVTGRIDKKSGWLLVPYLLWVSFAGILNFAWMI